MFQSPSMRDDEAGVSCILGVSGSLSESAHLPICFSSLDGVANAKPGLLSADVSRSRSENAVGACEEDAGDDGIGSRDGEDGAASADDEAAVAEPWRSIADAVSSEGNGRSSADSDSGACEAGDSIARRLRGRGERGRESPRDEGREGLGLLGSREGQNE